MEKQLRVKQLIKESEDNQREKSLTKLRKEEAKES